MSFLKKIVKLRAQARILQEEIDSLMPDCLSEAVSMLGKSPGKKGKTVYEDELGRVIVGFYKQLPIPEEVPALNRLDEDISSASAQLAIQNSAELEEIESKIQNLRSAIAALEERQQSLLVNEHILKCREKYEELEAKSTSLKPRISVLLKP